MGNSFSGIPRRLVDLDERRLSLEQRDYLYKLKEHLQNESLKKVAGLLNQKVPGYFTLPNPRTPIILPPLPGKGPPNTRLPPGQAPIAPPAPSFIHYHPSADLLRYHLFRHIFSDKFSNTTVPTSKLFVQSSNGDGDGELKIAYIYMIPGIHKKKSTVPCPLNLDEKTELQAALPTLSKLRLVVKTSLTISKTLEEHAKYRVPGPTLNMTHECVRIMEIRAEMVGFDGMNRIVRPPGVVGVGARLFVEQEREMGQLVERKGWEECVQQIKEVCMAVIEEDGGVWEFVKGGWEELAVEVEGEGLVNCFVVREEEE